MRNEPERLRARWRALGLPGIVDVHTHFMPKRVMDKVWQYFDRAGPLIGVPWPIHYREDETTRLLQLRSFGVLAFDALIYAHKPDMAEWLNVWARTFAGQTPDCLHTATFYPEPSAAGYVREAIDSGARVFKVHVQVGDFDLHRAELDAVWGMLEEQGTPIVLHAGSGPQPGRFTGPLPVARLLQRFPHLRLIIAHMGLPEYVEFCALAEQHPQVYLDTTMAFTDFIEQMAPFSPAERPRLLGLRERILFGSDFPNIPYPYEHAIDALERLELGDAWLGSVLFHNAARLFALKPTAP